MPQFVVGALQGASAFLVSSDHHTLELPFRLMPLGIHVGSVLDLEIRVNQAAEKARYQKLLDVFDSIYEATAEFVQEMEDEPVAYDEPSVAYSESNLHGAYQTDQSVLESEDENSHEISCNNARTSRAASQSIGEPVAVVPSSRKLSTPSPLEAPRLKRADSSSSERSQGERPPSPRDRFDRPVQMTSAISAARSSPLSPRDRLPAVKSPRVVVSPLPLPPLPAAPPPDSSLYALAKAGNTIPRGEKLIKTPVFPPIVPARLASSVSLPNLNTASAVPPLDLSAARVLYHPTAAAKDISVAQSFSRRDEELAEDP